MFVDGRTDNFHTEKECAYTFITVPQQVLQSNVEDCNKPKFIFKIDEDRHLILPLITGLSFLYNAIFLTHRQSNNPSTKKEAKKFFNISSYANEKLFDHLRLSFKRMVNDN